MAGVGAPATLPSLSLVLEAGALPVGTLAKTLGALTASGAGKVEVSGTANPDGMLRPLGALSLASAGTTSFNYGSIEAPAPLPHLSLVMYAIGGIIGGTAKALDALTVDSAGDVPGNEVWPYDTDDKPARPPIYWPRSYNIDWFQTTPLRDDTGGLFGAVLRNLEPLTALITATAETGCTLAKTLEDMTCVSTDGTVEVGGTLTATLDALTATATASVLDDIVATLYQPLEAMTLASEGIGDATGTLDQTLAPMTSAATVGNEITGTTDRTLQGINADINASVLSDIVATDWIVLGDMTLSARGHTDRRRIPDGGFGIKAAAKKKKPLLVKIDDEEFIVESVEEAEALLEQAREVYQQQVNAFGLRLLDKASKPTLDIKPVRMPRIRAEGPPGPDLDALVKEVAEMRAEIRGLYEKAAAAQKKFINDDEEALALLL